jgi:hypothetical protein
MGLQSSGNSNSSGIRVAGDHRPCVKIILTLLQPRSKETMGEFRTSRHSEIDLDPMWVMAQYRKTRFFSDGLTLS